MVGYSADMKLLGLLICIACAACTEHGKGGGLPPTDGGGSGDVCGGLAGAQCVATEFCDFPRNSCGATDEQGTCRTRPTGCPDLFQPTCGCDGQIHGSPCDTNAAGTDVSDIGSCSADPGLFACGHLFCDLATTYCQRGSSDVGNEPDSFQCNQLPAGCGTPSCACLADEPCGAICAGAASSGFELTCPGG
jgi:hypothetical protein